MRIRGKKLARFVLPVCVASVLVAIVWSFMGSEDAENATARQVQLQQKLAVRERVRLARQAIESRGTNPAVAGVPSQPVAAATASGSDVAALGMMRASRDVALGEVSRLSNSLAKVVRDSEAFRLESARSMEAAKAEILERSKRIEVLQAQLGGLNQQLVDLGEKLSRQAARVVEAERQLAAMEGDRTEARRNLEVLLAEKGELEKRFRSKEALTAQLRKMRDDEQASRDSFLRLNWLGFAKTKKAAAGAPTSPGASKAAVKPPAKVAVKQAPKKPVSNPAPAVRTAESPRAKATRAPAAPVPGTRPRGSISAIPEAGDGLASGEPRSASGTRSGASRR